MYKQKNPKLNTAYCRKTSAYCRRMIESTGFDISNLMQEEVKKQIFDKCIEIALEHNDKRMLRTLLAKMPDAELNIVEFPQTLEEINQFTDELMHLRASGKTSSSKYNDLLEGIRMKKDDAMYKESVETIITKANQGLLK